MNTGSRLLFFSFMFSLVLHGYLIFMFKKTEPRQVVQTRSVVKVKLFTNSQEPVPKENVSERPRIQREAVVKNSSLLEVESLQSSRTLLKPISRAEVETVTRTHFQELSREAGSMLSQTTSTEPTIDSAFLKAAVPCQKVSLPMEWIQLKDFWPRQYQVQFTAQAGEDSQAFTVREMKALAGEAPALDERVRRAFERCLQKSAKGASVAQLQLSGALKPGPEEAYSVTIEFTVGSPRVASQQGY